MAPIIEEINRASAAMEDKKPEDLNRMRRRMGARNQNASIALYAFGEIEWSVDVLYYLELDIPKKEYDLRTMLETASHWMGYLADRIPRYYYFNDTAALILKTFEALKTCGDREEARLILKALQHYLSGLKFWLDLEIPWAELGEAYAKAKGDPKPAG